MKYTRAAFFMAMAVTAAHAKKLNKPWGGNNDVDGDNCPIIDVVECGETYTEGIISLVQDLICGNTTEVDNTSNAPITLNGTVVLDCNGHTISQVTESIGSAVECEPSRTLPSSQRNLDIKQTCGLLYINGLIVMGGATARNCNIQRFYRGADIDGEGSIEDSDINLNAIGMQIGTFRAPNGMAKVVRTNTYNNGRGGLGVFQGNDDDTKVLIEDVTSKNNGNAGMQLTGTGITVRNVEVTYSGAGGRAGISIRDDAQTNAFTEINFEGTILSHSNVNSGVDISDKDTTKPVNGTVSISANLKTYNNGLNGLGIESGSLLDVMVEKGGSITACNNGGNTAIPDDRADIFNNGTGTIGGLPKYVCDSTGGIGDLPDCKPCPPCYSPLKSPPYAYGKGRGRKDEFDEWFY